MPHVAACQSCQTTLRELGMLPDLLELVPRSVVEQLSTEEVHSAPTPGGDDYITDKAEQFLRTRHSSARRADWRGCWRLTCTVSRSSRRSRPC